MKSSGYNEGRKCLLVGMPNAIHGSRSNVYKCLEIEFTGNEHMNQHTKVRVVSLNLSTALTNLNGDSDLLRSLSQIFVEDLPSIVLALQCAMEKNDRSAMARHAHTIYGLACNFEMEELMQTAKRLELQHAVIPDEDLPKMVSEIALLAELTMEKLKLELGL